MAAEGIAKDRQGRAAPISLDWHILIYTLSICRGFQLLAKMGYKAGEGIGKDRQGRAAPLSLDLKAGRTGLGVDEEKKRKQQGYKQLQELRSEFANKHCKAPAEFFAGGHVC